MRPLNISRIPNGQLNTNSMEEQVKKIKHYVHILNNAMGIDISVEVKGTLGVIREQGNIIFTTSGPQPVAIVEAYLMGFVTALTR